MSRLIALTVVLLILAAGPARADAFHRGLTAYNIGDFARALQIWNILAEEGDAKAQSGLGLLYFKGLGVVRDSRAAARWFYKAANAGVPAAQLFLASMHITGDGVERSPVLAYMWSDIALMAGYSEAIGMRDEAVQNMSQGDVDEARRMIVEWQATYAARGESGSR